MIPLPYVRQEYSFVCQEGKHRLLSATHTTADYNSNATMAIRGNQMKNNFAGNVRSHHLDRFYTGSQDSQRFDKNKRSLGSFRGRSQCAYCGDMGHFVEKCYQLHGYPPGHPKARTCSIFNCHKNTYVANQVSYGANKDDGKSVVTGISEVQLQQLLSLLNDKDGGTSSQENTDVAKPGLSKISSPHWIINSGAIDHISSSPKLFWHEEKNISLPLVLLPSREKANIIAKGSLPLNSVYYLHDVLCVPTFKVNLMSVSQLTRDLNCSMTSFPYWCVLLDLATRWMIGLGKQHDEMYYLAALTTRKIETTCHSSPNR